MTGNIKTWTFVGSILLSILAGLNQLQGDWAIWVLAVLGLVVGYLNVSNLEVGGFLLSAIALQLSAGAMNVIPEVGDIVTNILTNIVIFTSAILLYISVREILKLRTSRVYSLWVLGAGVVLAIFSAFKVFGEAATWPIVVLALVGVAVGVMDVSKKDINKQEIGRFIIAAIALVISANAIDNVPIIGDFLTVFFTGVVVLISATLLFVSFAATFKTLDQAGE